MKKTKRNKLIVNILGFIAGVGIVGIFCLALAWPFLMIWNYAVVQAVDFANTIQYWPAFWLMMFLAMFVAGAKTGTK